MGNLHIEAPWFLLALLLIPLVIWIRKRRRDDYGVAMHLPFDSVPAGLPSFRKVFLYVSAILPVLFFILAILGLARPQLTLTEESVNAEGIDIMMVMDISSSMLSRDFDPDRLTVSKAVATEFVDKRPYDRIGLAAFAGESYTQSPLTTDHQILKTFIDNLTCGYLEDGTSLGMGLAAGVNRIKDSQSESKVIILLTDGVNNGGYISPETAMELAKEFNIKVYTIGVGSEGYAESPAARTQSGGYRFAMRKVQIDEKLLRRIARETGAAYYRATSGESLKRIYEEIDQLEKTEMEITVYKRYRDLFEYLVGAALICLVLQFLLKFIILKTWP